MENWKLIFKTVVFAWANEKGEPQPPGRNARQTPERNDGALGAKAASVTE